VKNQAQKLLLLLAILLLVLTVPAGAASPAVPGPQVCLQQAPFFSDASAPRSATLIFPPPPQRCGACSTGGCAGSVAFSKCGVGRNGQYLFCVDGGTCPADGLLFCSCSQPS
jgi:hypothetical protein